MATQLEDPSINSNDGNLQPAASDIQPLAAQLKRPLQIGKRWIANRLVLAPMTQLGNVAFRELLAGFGGYGLLFAEMCNAKRLPSENRHVSDYFRWRDTERSHLVWQLFGNDPTVMATAARRIEDEGFFGVDLNFGCAVKRICVQNCGADLLKTPDLAVRIVAAVRQAVELPLFVKFRTGWRDDPHLPVTLARRFEAAGADALTFHPRVAPDRRSRPPRWPYIGQVKQAVRIPVFGNGDVIDAADCRRMLHTTGCDGVAVGRAAVARPWSFAAWSDGLIPPTGLYRQVAYDMLALLRRHFAPPTVLRRYKRFCSYFAANFLFGHQLYSQIRCADSPAAIAKALNRFFQTPPVVVARPHLNLLH